MPLPLQVSAPIDGFAIPGGLVVERQANKVQNQYGGWDAGGIETFTIDPVTAHTVTGLDLQQVPEADRTSEIVQFYAKVSSFPVGKVGFRVADGGYQADVINYNGRRYRLINTPNYGVQGNVWIAMGAREDLQAVA